MVSDGRFALMVVLVLMIAVILCSPCDEKEGYGPPPGTGRPIGSDPVDATDFNGVGLDVDPQPSQPLIGEAAVEMIPSLAADRHCDRAASRVFPRGAADTPPSRRDGHIRAAWTNSTIATRSQCLPGDPPGTRRMPGEVRLDMELREAVKTPYVYDHWKGQARSASGSLRGMVRA